MELRWLWLKESKSCIILGRHDDKSINILFIWMGSIKNLIKRFKRWEQKYCSLRCFSLNILHLANFTYARNTKLTTIYDGSQIKDFTSTRETRKLLGWNIGELSLTSITWTVMLVKVWRGGSPRSEADMLSTYWTAVSKSSCLDSDNIPDWLLRTKKPIGQIQ